VLRFWIIWVVLLPLGAHAAPVKLITEFEVGLSAHTLELEDDNDDTDNDSPDEFDDEENQEEENQSAVAFQSRIGAGLEFLSVLSATVNAWAWGPFNDQTADDNKFSAFSVGWQVTAHLPVRGFDKAPIGPFARVGRHCWSASIRQSFTRWEDSGCSMMYSAGVSLIDEVNRSVYLEAMKTDFGDVESFGLMVSVRAHFGGY